MEYYLELDSEMPLELKILMETRALESELKEELLEVLKSLEALLKWE
jgi:hypothetical protein